MMGLYVESCSFHTSGPNLLQTSPDVLPQYPSQSYLKIFEILTVSNTMKLWNFNMEVKGKILKSRISGTRLIVVRMVTGGWGSGLGYYLWNKKYGSSNFFVNTEPYRTRNFKTLPFLRFSSDLSQTLWGHWLLWWNTGCYFSHWYLNMGVNRKILTCNILKTAGRRATRMKI